MELFYKHLFDINVPDHARLFTLPVVFSRCDIQGVLYPQVVVFEDGVILAAFKMINGETALDISEFIQSVVNFPLHEADSVKIPAALLRSVLRIDRLRTGSLPQRMSALLGRLQRGMDHFIKQRSHDDLELAPGKAYFTVEEKLVPAAGTDEVSALTLRGLSEQIEDLVGWAALSRYERARRAIGWRSSVHPLAGTTWTGRPEAYLLDYDGKPTSKERLTERSRSSFLRILARSLEADLGTADCRVSDLRHSDDYSAYFNEAMSLFVFYGRLEFEDTLDKHVQIEFVEYLYAAHRMVERSIRRTSLFSSRQILQKQLRIYDLEDILRHAARYGEIRELIRQASNSLNLPSMRDRMKEMLSAKQAFSLIRLDARSRAFGWLIAVVAGVLAAPALGSGLILPITDLFEVTNGWTEPKRTLFGTTSALLVWFLATAVSWVLLRPREGD